MPGCRRRTIHDPARNPERYRQRVLRDLPWQGRPILIHFRSRCFRCSSASCPRRTFIERLGGFARVHARRTERVSALHRYIGLAMAGARLVESPAMPVSADTLLRVARQNKRAVNGSSVRTKIDAPRLPGRPSEPRPRSVTDVDIERSRPSGGRMTISSGPRPECRLLTRKEPPKCGWCGPTTVTRATRRSSSAASQDLRRPRGGNCHS